MQDIFAREQGYVIGLVRLNVSIYSRRHKKVPVPYCATTINATLSKTLRSYYGANRNYGSPIYSVIARFIRVNNARA